MELPFQAKVRKFDHPRQKEAPKAWLEGAKADKLEFVDFDDLSSIIIQNWEPFKAIIPSRSGVSRG